MQTDKNLYDVIIVGGGPAGLSAAIYMARARYKVLVLEKASVGGQITITSEIVNYPGIGKTSGKELTEEMRRQAEQFGAQFAITEVLDMELKTDMKVLHTTREVYKALGVILATGANPRKIGFRGEKEFQGRGVAYCATCDGEFFTGREVFVIGGGFAAVEESIFLTKYAKKVTIVVRRDKFSCAKAVSDKLKDQEKIEVLFHTEITEVDGEGIVSRVKFRNNSSGKEWTYEDKENGGFGIFVFAGYVPNTRWIGEAVQCDERGYLITDANQKTNLYGVYGAGDVCVKNLRQVVTAVSDGAVAATSLERVVSDLHVKLGIPELQLSVPQEGKKSADIAAEGFISKDIKAQLTDVFAKFARKVKVRAWLDESPLSGEIVGFLRELESITEKVEWEKADGVETDQGPILPSMELCYEDGTSSGIQFHGVPGGHEFNSFIIALYNLAGPGQAIEQTAEEKLRNITEKKNLKILVSLSCTMCPETVISAQKAAALSRYVEAEMFDLSRFPELKNKYKVMSVPCLILNDEEVFFGKKGVEDIVNLLTRDKQM